MRIGILGGTFDPPHKGHLALANAALKELCLDRLIFVPAFLPPLKQKIDLTPPADRFAMVRCAIREEPRFEVSDCELKRKGISYTVDTLRFFRKQYPEPAELFFITGGDWGKTLDQWKEIDVAFSLAHFVVAKRPGFKTDGLRPEVAFLDFVPLNISSTGVRDRLARCEMNVSEIPDSVLEYIRQHKLYHS